MRWRGREGGCEVEREGVVERGMEDREGWRQSIKP